MAQYRVLASEGRQRQTVYTKPLKLKKKRGKKLLFEEVRPGLEVIVKALHISS
jgi:hypothetical protein